MNPREIVEALAPLIDGPGEVRTLGCQVWWSAAEHVQLLGITQSGALRTMARMYVASARRKIDAGLDPDGAITAALLSVGELV